jgi:transcriptional regulator with XRE-family HTH domain
VIFEVGYTPTNLRLALTKLGLTQAAIARLLGVAERTLRQWLNEDLESRNHADMPLKQWRKVLELLKAIGICR